MRVLSKYAVVATLTGALALAVATPTQARWWGHHHGGGAAAAAIGFGAGALIGAAAANSAYYNSGYYDPGYAYGPGYAYEPAPYAYEPAPAYEAYGYAQAPVPRSCWHGTDTDRGFGYQGSCATSHIQPGARTPRTGAQ
jgi:hypothetical protein